MKSDDFVHSGVSSAKESAVDENNELRLSLFMGFLKFSQGLVWSVCSFSVWIDELFCCFGSILFSSGFAR